MSIIQKITQDIHWSNKTATRAFLKEMDAGHPTGAGGLWWWSPAKDLASIGKVRDGSSNSIVVTSLLVLTDGFLEAPAIVHEESDEGLWEPIRDHPVNELLMNPNPFMTADLLWSYYIWSTRVDGNAYLYKQRSGSGQVVELWPLRPDLTNPNIPRDPRVFIDSYTYTPDGREVILPAEDVIHLRIAQDPTNFRKGLAPLRVVLGEVLADEAAAQFSTALLSNMAIPGVIIGPKTGDSFSSMEIDEVWKDKFGGGNAGLPLTVDAPIDIKVISFSPEQMDFKTLRRVPEERITAALRVPAILAGLGAGIEESSGKSEGVALIELFTEKTLIPDWQRVGRMLTNQLLRDFDENPTHRIEFDLANVRSLQEDQNAVWERVDSAVSGGWLTVAEAKKMVKVDPNPNDDVYLRSVAIEEVPADEGMRALPPPPQEIPPQLLNGGEPAEELEPV